MKRGKGVNNGKVKDPMKGGIMEWDITKKENEMNDA